MKQISDEQLEQIGLLADKADNFHGASQLPLPPQMHVKQLSVGMKEIRNELREIHTAISGEDVWVNHPKD
jgi:hypothetical protein